MELILRQAVNIDPSYLTYETSLRDALYQAYIIPFVICFIIGVMREESLSRPLVSLIKHLSFIIALIGTGIVNLTISLILKFGGFDPTKAVPGRIYPLDTYNFFTSFNFAIAILLIVIGVIYYVIWKKRLPYKKELV